MRKRFFVAPIILWTLFSIPVWAETTQTIRWDAPKPVDPNTTLLTELERPSKELPGQPKPSDKNYAWYNLEKGNSYLLAGDKEKAASFFREAYQTPSSARVVSGFKLIDTLEEMGFVDEAIRILDEMNEKFLVSTREYGEAKRVRMRLEDKKRQMGAVGAPRSKMLGKDWLYQVSTWRSQYALDAMEVLRRYEIPLEYPVYHYAFLMDEYFLKHPDVSADDGPEILAKLVYQEDPEARGAIDRWRQDPTAPPAPHVEARLADHKGRITGADWVTMVHDRKMKYTLEAMAVLEKQRVPMQKSAIAYNYAIDEFFTSKPELPAHDSVATLATILYNTEPEARRILEALRLES